MGLRRGSVRVTVGGPDLLPTRTAYPSMLEGWKYVLGSMAARPPLDSLHRMVQLALAAAGKDKSAVMKVQRKADGILQTLVSLTLRNDLTSIQRTSLETCITVYMHQKEVGGDVCLADNRRMDIPCVMRREEPCLVILWHRRPGNNDWATMTAQERGNLAHGHLRARHDTDQCHNILAGTG